MPAARAGAGLAGRRFCRRDKPRGPGRAARHEGSDMPREIVFRSKKFDVAIDRTPRPGGGTVERALVLHPGAVAVLPLLDAERVCLLRNFRPAVGEELW